MKGYLARARSVLLPKLLFLASTLLVANAMLVANVMLASGASTALAGERRVALVIGNGAYAHASALPNPVNDAVAMKDTLERIGFDLVIMETDLDRMRFQRTLQRFTREVQTADMALVFYAGHGIEMGGQNFLIPTDAELASDVDVAFEAVPLDLVLRSVESAKRLRVVLLDACRNNPFATRMVRSAGSTRSVGRGLARIEPPGDMLVAYAAKDGQVAEDGFGANSPFTNALLEHMESPGLEIQFLFRKVRDSVLQATGYRQEPHVYGSLGGDPFYFIPPVERPASGSDGTRVALELAFWNAIESSTTVAPFAEYLRQFPEGVFAGLARIKIETMQAADEGRVAGAEVAALVEEPADRQPPAAPGLPEAVPVQALRPTDAGETEEAGIELPPLEERPTVLAGEARLPAAPAVQVAALVEGAAANAGGGPAVMTGPAEASAVSGIAISGAPEAGRPAPADPATARPAVDSFGLATNHTASVAGNAAKALSAEVKTAALTPGTVLPSNGPAPGLAQKALPGMLIVPAARPASPPMLARAWLQEIPCTVVDVAMRGALLDVTGYSREPGIVMEATTRMAGQALPAVGEARIEPLAASLCPPIESVGRMLGRTDIGNDARTLVDENDALALVDVEPVKRDWFTGEELALELGGPLNGHVTLVLFDEDAMARPLAVDTPRATTRRIADDAWRLPSTTGPHLLMALVTNRPIGLNNRGDQPTATYLASLEEVLGQGDVAFSVGFAVLRSTDRPAPAVATPAPPKVSRPAQAQAAVNKPSRPKEDPRCAEIIMKATLGEYLSNEDRTILQSGCR